MNKHTPAPWQWSFRDRSVSLIHPHRGHLIDGREATIRPLRRVELFPEALQRKEST